MNNKKQMSNCQNNIGQCCKIWSYFKLAGNLKWKTRSILPCNKVMTTQTFLNGIHVSLTLSCEYIIMVTFK